MKRKTGLKVRDVAKDHFSSGLSNTVPNFSRLVITFLEGKSLLASDVETGKSDPVCFVWCGPIDETPDLSDSSEENENGILKTKVCPTTTDPIWNEDIVFPIELSDIASLSSLKCSIYCRDEDISETGDVTYDELGMIELPFKEILSRGKSLKNSIVISASWYTLKASPGMRRVDGKIKLTINLIIDNSDFENVSNQLLQQGANTPNTSITQQLQNMHKSIDLSATGAGPVSGETLLNTVRSSAGFSTSLNSARPRPSSASPTRGRMSNQWETGSAAGSNTARSTSRERGRSLKNNKNAMTIGSAVIKTKRPSTAPLMSSVPEFVGANNRYSNLQSTDSSVDMDGRSEIDHNEMYGTGDSVLSETERSEDYTVEDEDEEEELFVIPKHQNKKSHKKHLAKRPYTAEYETIPEEISPRAEQDTERDSVQDTARDTTAGDTVKDTARSTVKSAGRSVVSGTAANKISGEADGEAADDPQEPQERFDFNLPQGDEGVMDDVVKMGMHAATGAVKDILAEGQIQNIAASVSQLVAAKVTDAKAITHMLKENISEATKKNSQNVANFVAEQSTGSNLSNIGSSVGNALQEMAKSVSSIKAPQIAYNEVSARLLDGLKAVGDDVLESTLVEKMNDKIKSITAPKSKLVGGAAGAAARATAKQTGNAHSVDPNNDDDADADTIGTDIPVEKANKRKTVERTLIPPREEDGEDGHENESIGEITSLKPSLGVADPKQTRARTGSTSTAHSLARSVSKEMTTQEFDPAAVPRSSSRDRGDSRSVVRSEQSRTTAGTRDGRESGARPASGKKSSGTASGSGAVDNSGNNRRLSSSTKNTTSASTLFGDGPARGDQSMAPDMWDDEAAPEEKYQSRVPVPPLKLSSEPRVKPAPRPVQQEPHEHKQRSRSQQQPVEQQQQQQQQRRSRSPQSRSKHSSSQSKHRPVPSQYSETDVEAEEYYSMDEDRERAERGLQRSASMTGSTTSVIRALKEMNQGRVVMEKSLQELTNITKQGLSNLSDRITKIEEAATSNPLNLSPSRGDQSMPPEADDPKAKSTTKQSRLKSAIAKVATTKSVTSRWDASPLRTSSPKRTSAGAAGGGAAGGAKQSDVEGFKRAQKKYMYNSNNYASSLEDLLPPVEKKPPAPVEPEITIMYRTDDGRIAAAINSPSRQQATENYQDDYARAPRVRSRDKQLQLQNPDNNNNNNNGSNNNNGNQNNNNNGNGGGGGGGNGGGYPQPYDNRASQDNQNHPPSNNNNNYNGNNGIYNQPPGASPMHFNNNNGNNNGNNMGGNNYGGQQDNKSRINTDFPELDSNNVYRANSPDRPLQATLNHNNNIGAAGGGGYNAGYNNYNGGNGGNSNQNTGNLGAVFPPYEDNRASRDVLKAYNNGNSSNNNNNVPQEAPPTFSNSANIGNALGYSGNFGIPAAPIFAPAPHSPVHITSDLKPKINRDFCEVLDRGTLEDIVLLMQTTGPKPELLAPSTRNRLYDSIATLLHQRKHTERCLVWVLVLVRSQENLLATMAGHSKRDLVESLGKATTEPGKRGQLASLLRSQIIKQME